MESKLTEVGAGRGSYTKEQRVTYGYRHGIGSGNAVFSRSGRFTALAGHGIQSEPMLGINVDRARPSS